LNVAVDTVPERKVEVAGGGEIANIGVVPHFQATDRFRNEKVQICVALAVRIGWQVDRHVVPKDG
jgi:hypothetical protein